MNNLNVSFQSMREVLLSAANSFFSTFAGYIPSIIGAIIIFIIGLVISSGLRSATRKILDWVGFSNATDKAELNDSLNRVGIKSSVSDMIASLIYWIVFLIFLTASFETLGLEIVVTTLNDLISYLPHVIVATITIVLVLLLARFLKGLISATLQELHISFARIVANIAEVFVILFGSAIAATQLGLDVSIITANITLIVAGVVAILVLALGLGSRTVAGNFLNSYYAKQVFKKGSVVNLGGFRGKVKEVNQVAVIMEVDGSEVIIPNEQALKRGSITTSAK
jgi:hypothetical protein